MYELLIPLIVVLLAVVKGREHFALKVWTKDWYTTDSKRTDGYEVFNSFPHTCPPPNGHEEKTELDAALCYPPCRAGYHGVGPVCWADSVNIGIGRAVGLEPCPAGWNNDGLICREPIKCASGWAFFTEGCSGGRLRGRLNSGGICDWPSDRGNLPSWLVDKSDSKNYKATHPDKVDGLCYRKCPERLPNHIPGMPYLCYKGGPLSYGRGVGVPPPLAKLFSTYAIG